MKRAHVHVPLLLSLLVMRRDMPHELTHLIFHQQDHSEVPLWFDEGIAVHHQHYHV
jgi:hypothetical protein